MIMITMLWVCIAFCAFSKSQIHTCSPISVLHIPELKRAQVITWLHSATAPPLQRGIALLFPFHR